MGSGTGDKAEGKWDELRGRAKESAGDLTDDESKQAEGKTDQMKGKGKQAWGNVKDAGDRAKEAAKDLTD